MLTYLSDKESRDKFIDSYDTFLFDCDGVLWEGKNTFPQIREAMTALRQKGKKFFFVTNNSTKSRSSFLDKFKTFGIEAHIEEIYSSSYATAAYMKNVLNFPDDKKVYIIGEIGIKQELETEGIRSCGGQEDNGSFENEEVPDDSEVGAVVVGLDTQVNYRKYAKAFAYLTRNPGCYFILTNEDYTFPQHGSFYPGAGSIAAPLITALGRRPDAVLGKPAQNMLEAIHSQHNLDFKKTVMIGDRLDTDIEFGLHAGIDTLCVLTGVTKKEELLSDDNQTKSTYYIDSFGDLIN